MTEVQKKQVAAWLAQWSVGSRGLHRAIGGQLRVTAEAHKLRPGGWPALRLREEMGHTRWCAYGDRRALVPEKEDSRG